MNTYLTVSVAMLTGIAIGGVAIQGLHAQGKPPVYLITEVDVTIPTSTRKSSRRKLRRRFGQRLRSSS